MKFNVLDFLAHIANGWAFAITQGVRRRHSHLYLILGNNWTKIKSAVTGKIQFQISI